MCVLFDPLARFSKHERNESSGVMDSRAKRETHHICVLGTVTVEGVKATWCKTWGGQERKTGEYEREQIELRYCCSCAQRGAARENGTAFTCGEQWTCYMNTNDSGRHAQQQQQTIKSSAMHRHRHASTHTCLSRLHSPQHPGTLSSRSVAFWTQPE